MCRIAGFWELYGKANYDRRLEAIKMRDTMIYGGPDDAGVYVSRSGPALAHRRLSIIDITEAGHQPMAFDELVIVYNGEIYNYNEIKKELEKLGRKFSTNSDTEVVLQSYREWGEYCFQKFRGIWAMAIWDEREKKLVLSRDRVGVKPLYWHLANGLFMFASELKAFIAHRSFFKKVNYEGLGFFFQYGYITSPYTIFQDVYKLEPGTILSLDRECRISQKTYWDVSEYYAKGFEKRQEWLKRSEDDVCDELESILVESFELRMVSDVPVGMFLSGGVDSSLLVALLAQKKGNRLKTFTIGFLEEKYDEAKWAGKVSGYLGTDHTQLYCTPAEALKVIPKLPDMYDEPFGDASAIPTYLVSKLARTHVTVSLSADGGDELFCGYDRYFLMDRILKDPLAPVTARFMKYMSPEIANFFYGLLPGRLKKWNNFRDKYDKLGKVLKVDSDIEKYDTGNMYFFPDDFPVSLCENLMRQTFKMKGIIEGADSLTRMMLLDVKTYLPDDILVKLDRASMSVALEGRDPFLDHKIIEFAASLPIEFKYKDGIGKNILKKILYRHVPRELIDRPKKGFGVPVHEWLGKELLPLIREHLEPEKIRREGILRPDCIKNLIDAHMNGRGVNAYKLWLIFIFELWYEKYMSAC